VDIERGIAGTIPYAAVGSGRTVVVCAGLWPTTGVDSGRLVRGAIIPLRRMAGRRVVVLNRRPHLPRDISMRDMASEYADAIRSHLGAPADVLGTSTGGSIAQQVAADHPDVVRRLVLLSTACRLGPFGREVQSQVAERLRAGRYRSAVATMGADIAPRGFRTLARGLGWASARHVLVDAATSADLAATLEAEDGFDLARCPKAIQAMTLIVAGGRDRYYSRELFAETAALIPNSHLRLFSRRGHVTVMNDPRAHATVAGFLSES
jgi:pimeloyl-ACP methyl ester carboxylesterase